MSFISGRLTQKFTQWSLTFVWIVSFSTKNEAMAVKQATLSLVLKRHATAGVSLSPRDWMRLPPFKRETGCQCRHFLCVSPVACCPATGQLPPGACPISAAWWRRGARSRWRRRDCLAFFRGGIGDGTQAFRLAALTQASPSAASLCNYRPSRRSCGSYSTPENVQENTGPSSWQTTHGPYLKEDQRAFSKHLLETVYSPRWPCLKKKKEGKRQWGKHMQDKIDSWEKEKYMSVSSWRFSSHEALS